jgi:hypothetical protein
MVALIGLSLAIIAVLTERRPEPGMGLSLAFYRMWEVEPEQRFDPGIYLHARINLSAYQQLMVPFGDLDYRFSTQTIKGVPEDAALLAADASDNMQPKGPAGIELVQMWDFGGGSAETVITGSADSGWSDLHYGRLRTPTPYRGPTGWGYALRTGWGKGYAGPRANAGTGFRPGGSHQYNGGAQPIGGAKLAGVQDALTPPAAAEQRPPFEEVPSSLIESVEEALVAMDNADVALGDIVDQVLDIVRPQGLKPQPVLPATGPATGSPVLASQANVPEPGSLGLIALGLGLLVFLRRR